MLNVKVVKVEGRPYLCTVYPMVAPRPEDDIWGQQLRSRTPHRYSPVEEESLLTGAARTKLDQEN